MTKLISEVDVNRVRVFGDWHANTKYAVEQLRKAVDDGVTTFVHVGDFGVWSSRTHYLIELSGFCIDNDCTIFFIDGNHEEFPVLDALDTNDDGTKFLIEGISYLPRGFVWEWNGVKLAALGGAVSIDRMYRTEGWDYFKDEEITQADVDKLLSAGKFDVLFSHEAPRLPVPKIIFGNGIDEDCEKSIEFVESVVTSCEPKLNVHGHYHVEHMTFVGSTVVKGLDRDDTYKPWTSNYIDVSFTDMESFVRSIEVLKRIARA